MTYFLIRCSGDGEVLVSSCDSFSEIIGKKHYGHIKFMETLDIDDPTHWEGQMLIIKGDIATPRIEQVVVTNDK